MLKDFSLTPPGGDAPIVQLQETIVQINRDALIDHQQLEVQKVTIKSPRLEIVRGHDGRWNWQSFVLPKNQDALPEFVIEDGTVVVRVEQAPAAHLSLDPSAARTIANSNDHRARARSPTEAT